MEVKSESSYLFILFYENLWNDSQDVCNKLNQKYCGKGRVEIPTFIVLIFQFIERVLVCRLLTVSSCQDVKVSVSSKVVLCHRVVVDRTLSPCHLQIT